MSFWADVLSHAAFFIGFLPLFFFLYVSPTQVKALSKDIFEILKPYIVDSLVSNNPNAPDALISLVNTTSSDMKNNSDLNYAFSDKIVKNKMIITIVAATAGILFPILLGIAIYLEYRSGGSIVNLLLANLVVLAFVAISEFAIVGLFLQNLVEVDDDYVKAEISNQYYSPNYYKCMFVEQYAKEHLPSFMYNLFFRSS